MLVADKLANGKEPKEARRGCAMFAMAIKSWGAGLVLAGEHRDVHVLASPNLKHQPAQERSQTSQTVQRCMRRLQTHFESISFECTVDDLHVNERGRFSREPLHHLRPLPSTTAGLRSTCNRLPYGCLLFMYR